MVEGISDCTRLNVHEHTMTKTEKCSVHWQGVRLARAAAAAQESALCLSLLTKKFLDSVGEPMWEIRHRRRIGHGARDGDGDARALRESERRDEVIERRFEGDRERMGWAGIEASGQESPADSTLHNSGD